VTIPKGSKPKDAVYNNNKYYVFSEFVNNASQYYPSNIFYSINNAIVRDNSLAPVTTLTNKRDVWITESVPVTTTTGTVVNTYFTAIRQASIRANDDVYINKVSEVFDTNKVFLALSTAAGTGYDKTAIQKGGQDYWIVKFNLNTMTKMWDTTFGGTSDDFVRSISFNDGVLVVSGESISAIGGNKTVANYGAKDFWTLNYCLPPKAEFSSAANILDAADNVQFNNLSQYATEFNWNFGDGVGSFDKDPLHYYNSPGYYSVQLISSNGNCSATVTKTNYIYVKNYVGIQELNLVNGHLIFPNPNDGKFYLSEFAKNVTIVNVLGQEQMFERNGNNIILNVVEGIYTVSYSIDNHTYNEQLIIKK
jgi:PKD repeat protein